MVMEAPSPQCVGREFVRQYYTILNKAPCHLHRFYASNSSFMHGEENRNCETIVGQSDIHKCIKELNFKDCHAKILLIDSQATMADGVVIQVTGELSNDGRPMRRFMQTFVLAPQSEKKYYVHNDIFRYQDQVFNDDCDGGEEGSDELQQDNGHAEEIHPQQVAQEMTPVAPEPAPVVVAPPPGVPAPAAVMPTAAAPVEYQQAPAVAPAMPVAPVAAQVHTSVPQQQQVLQQQAPPPPPPQQHINGGIVSAQELSSVAVPNNSHHHTMHAPAAPHHTTAQSPPQASVAPHHTTHTPTAHIAQQVDSGLTASVTPAPTPVQDTRDDGWAESGGWGDEDAPAVRSSPAQPQGGARQQQHQQQRSVPAPPQHQPQQQTASRTQQPTQHTQKAPEKKPEPQQSVSSQGPGPKASYAAWFKNTSSVAAPPAPVTTQQTHYQPRETTSSRPSQQQPSQASAAREAPQHPREQRNNNNTNNNMDRNNDMRGGGGDRGDNSGFQRMGRNKGPSNNYRNNRSNYSESEQHNSEDVMNNGDSSTGGGGYGGPRMDDRRRAPAYPDSHQIFVGNVPQTMSDDELKGVFSKYGAIVDVRINTGKLKAGPANGKPVSVPNFGFITFEDDLAVHRCLGAKPIIILNDHRLNVEEKKAKAKIGEGGGYNQRPNMRPPMGGRNNFNRSEGGGRGGSRGGYGGGAPRR